MQPNEDERFSTLEHDYALYFLSRIPVVATYLGGAFDASLAGVDGKARDGSPQALKEEDAERGRFA